MVFDKVKKTIAFQLGIGEEDIKEENSFDDLGIDSLEIIEIVIALEEEFNIEVPNEDIEDIKDIATMTKYIESKLTCTVAK